MDLAFSAVLSSLSSLPAPLYSQSPFLSSVDVSCPVVGYGLVDAGAWHTSHNSLVETQRGFSMMQSICVSGLKLEMESDKQLGMENGVLLAAELEWLYIYFALGLDLYPLLSISLLPESVCRVPVPLVAQHEPVQQHAAVHEP